MHEWITTLKNAIETENADRPAVMTLATVSKNGSPRARSVICRRISDDGAIWITSDGRSKKGRQIRRTSRVELVLWLPTLRRQFRLRGKARVVGYHDPTAQELWRDLSPQTQAMFFWPELIDGQTKSDPPKTFEAIVVHPNLVEELDLTVEPHQRKRWKSKEKLRD